MSVLVFPWKTCKKWPKIRGFLNQAWFWKGRAQQPSSFYGLQFHKCLANFLLELDSVPNTISVERRTSSSSASYHEKYKSLSQGRSSYTGWHRNYSFYCLSKNNGVSLTMCQKICFHSEMYTRPTHFFRITWYLNTH